MKKEVNQSTEDYLESILMLSQKQDIVRSTNVADDLGFSRPSVSAAVKKLRDSGDVEVEGNGALVLTEKGRARAEKVYERHTILTATFEALGVSDVTAEEDACMIEHVISEETFQAVKKHYNRYKSGAEKA